MKKIMFAAAFLLPIRQAGAQSNSGEFKAQIRQIMLLKTYIQYLEKGYEIAKKGLTIIGDIKNADLHQHTDNFNSLKDVKPNIQKYAGIADMIVLDQYVREIYKKTIANMNASKLFSPGEVGYVSNVFKKLLEQFASNLEELITLTTSQRYEMKDDERLKRIELLQKELFDAYIFAQDFGHGSQLLALEKQKSQREVVSSRLLNNTKNP